MAETATSIPSASGFAFRPSTAARRGADAERDASLAVVHRKGVIALHKGDPCFETPEHICAAEREAVARGYTHYPELRGDPELRQVIADVVSKGAPRTYEAEEVLVTAGATQGLYCALTAFLDPGDEVLLFDPTFSHYAPVVRQTGAVPVRVQMTSDFRLDPERLASHIGDRTKLLVLNNPANPTGVVCTPQEIAALADFAVRANLLVLTDEVYDQLLFGGARHTRLIDIPHVADRVIYINSFSKTYAMTGWRLGHIVAPRPLLEPIATIHANSMSQVHWPAQRAGIAALTGPQSCVESMRAGYDQRREALLAGLSEIPGIRVVEPQGGFYVFLRFDPALGLSSAEVRSRLYDAGVAVRSGTEYGPAGEGWLRLTFSADLPEIQRGAKIVRETFQQLTAESDGRPTHPDIAGEPSGQMSRSRHD
jgi:aspartate aminotransferase